MPVSGAFRTLAEVIDELEATGADVVGVSFEGNDATAEGPVSVDLAVTVPALRGIDADDEVELSVEGATVEEGGTVTADLSVTVPTDDVGGEGDGKGREPHRGGEADRTSSSDPTPPHRDPERLRAAYEEYDTFPEMTEALGADVTPQTVRRQMIGHGIHEPASNGSDTGSADEGGGDPDDRGSGNTDAGADESGGDGGEGNEAGTALSDGIDLPADVTLPEVKRIVKSARTVHEAARDLGVERDRARRILSELDLLDLVSGRLADPREVSDREIDRRIEGASPTGI